MTNLTESLAKTVERRYGLHPLILQRVCIIGASNPQTKRIAQAIEGLDNATYAVPRYVFSDSIDQDPNAPHPIGRLHGWDALESLCRDNVMFANTVSGSTRARYEVFKRVTEAGGRMMNFIDPKCPLPDVMGEGLYLQGDIIIQADVEIGDNSTVHGGAILSHGVRIAKSCFVGAATMLGNSVALSGSYIGAGSIILPGVHVGSWATVGAGAVVLKNVPPGATVVGNPARIIKVEPIA